MRSKNSPRSGFHASLLAIPIADLEFCFSADNQSLRLDTNQELVCRIGIWHFSMKGDRLFGFPQVMAAPMHNFILCLKPVFNIVSMLKPTPFEQFIGALRDQSFDFIPSMC